MQAVIDTLVAFGLWLLDLLLWLPRKIFEQLSDEAVLLVESIPCANACYQVVASAHTVLTGASIAVTDGAPGALSIALQWLSMFLYVSALAVGLELVMCALLARFLIRRIPLIG